MKYKNKKKIKILFFLLTAMLLAITVRYGDVFLLKLGVVQEQKQEQDETPIAQEDAIENEGGNSIENGEALPPEVARYAYTSLTPEEQELYVKLVQGISLYEEELSLPNWEVERIKRILTCVFADYPEFFWWDGQYTIKSNTLGKSVIYRKATFEYLITSQEAVAHQEQLDQLTEPILSPLRNKTDYEKIKVLFEYLVDNVNYNPQVDVGSQTIYSTLLGKETVCSGYAKSLQYLLNRLGIQCVYLTGNTSDGQSHAWNLVLLDGEYYFVDPTWGDPIVEGSTSDNLTYAYFCITGEEIGKTHKYNEDFQLPVCTAIEDNYFIREGSYFTQLEKNQLVECMIRSLASGRDFCEVRFADEYARNEAVQALVEEQGIFPILKKVKQRGYSQLNERHFAYSINEDMNVLKIVFSFQE